MKTSLKCAQIGSISTGTLRDEDLIDSFHSELEWQIQRNGDFFSSPENFSERDRLNDLLGEVSDNCYDDEGNFVDSEEASYYVETLSDALGQFCAPYSYFGAHPGDGADFGYWPDFHSARECVEFASSHKQEYPSDSYRGEWLHVNDHGNATLYLRDEAGNDVELWSIV